MQLNINAMAECLHCSITRLSLRVIVSLLFVVVVVVVVEALCSLFTRWSSSVLVSTTSATAGRSTCDNVTRVTMSPSSLTDCFPVTGEKVLSHYSTTVNRCLYLILSVNVGFYFGTKC